MRYSMQIAPATPEDEVAAMQELNKKELAEVEGEEGSSASEKSPVGPGDLSPVRYFFRVRPQECRAVFWVVNWLRRDCMQLRET